MDVAHRQIDFKGAQAQKSIQGVLDQLMIERSMQSMILGLNAAPGDSRWHWRVVENRRKVETACFPMLNRRVRIKHIHAPDHLVHRAESQFRHILPKLLCEEE